MKTPTLAEQALADREYKTMVMPNGFSTYCYLCNAMLTPEVLVNRFDAATYTHQTCPGVPLKTYSPHRYLYGDNK